MKVYLKNLNHGWIDLIIKDELFIILDNRFSYIYNFLEDLLDGLYQLNNMHTISTKIILFGEPFAYELVFNKEDDVVNFKLFFIENYTGVQYPDKLIYEKVGNFKEICLPFWRALRTLQSRYNQKEFNELWQREFSYQKLERLSQIIKKK